VKPRGALVGPESRLTTAILPLINLPIKVLLAIFLVALTLFAPLVSEANQSPTESFASAENASVEPDSTGLSPILHERSCALRASRGVWILFRTLRHADERAAVEAEMAAEPSTPHLRRHADPLADECAGKLASLRKAGWRSTAPPLG
jgi:hypothetical protein